MLTNIYIKQICHQHPHLPTLEDKMSSAVHDTELYTQVFEGSHPTENYSYLSEKVQGTGQTFCGLSGKKKAKQSYSL